MVKYGHIASKLQSQDSGPKVCALLILLPQTIYKKCKLWSLYAKMGTIKDRNGLDLTEAEDIKKGWQEYTENCTKKVLMIWIITMV